MTSLLGLIHGLDLFLVSVLIGALVFQVGVIGQAFGAVVEKPSEIKRRFVFLGVLTFVSSLAWMIFSAFEMAESWGASDLWTVMSETVFGHLWCIRLIVIAVFVFSACFGSIRLCFLLALSLPLFSSLTGHAGATQSARWVWVGVDYLHALGAGVWSGGLISLSVWLSKRIKQGRFEENLAHPVVERFSHFAMVSTGAIALSGGLLSYVYGVPLTHPWSTTFGKVLLGKVGVFSLALAAAAVNQFIHLRKWHPEAEEKFSRALRREVRFEFLAVSLVFGLAGFLTRLSPLD